MFNELFTRAGAAAWGTCAFADLTLTDSARQAALTLCPNAQGVFIAAFPYYAGDSEGNLSVYARGEDYHLVLVRRLNGVIADLQAQFPSYHFVSGADNSPLDERQCARLAGLGVIGRHGLVMVEPYGSYVFLGTILTDYPLPSAPTPAPDCIGCRACERACPSGALRHSPFEESRCVSALTQKKGDLNEHETALLTAHPLIWGCDICQQVCPYNRRAVVSPLDDLTGRNDTLPYLPRLTAQDLEGLSNRTFREKYGQRAFAWRGVAVLRRNLSLKEPKGTA